MTQIYSSVLERELQAETTLRARHAIAQELDVYRRNMRYARQHGYGWMLEDCKESINTLLGFARNRFPRVHPAPGKLPWCLVNTHGPVCESRAEPGSDFCKAHAHYEDGAPRFGWGNPPMGGQ